MIWDMWKKGFNTWEATTAKYLEDVMRNPIVLGPAGQLMTTAMKAKAKSDQTVADWWGTVGLPTKRDQERTLHALNQMQSRILDLEEKIDELSK